MTHAYYRGAHAVILMYDISSEQSFVSVKTWINSIENNMESFPTCLLLVGNKLDLEEMNERKVLYETGYTFAKVFIYKQCEQ
jgi:GTPase SAR1 family protein